jgi:hypothetical protein
MTDTLLPDEFREAQQQLGLSDAQLAAVLGYGDAAHVRRHKVRDMTASSYRAPNNQVTRLIRAYLAGYRPDDWPA